MRRALAPLLAPALAALISAAPAAAGPAPRPTTIDLTEDDPAGELGEQFTGPPPDVQHPSMIQGKYRGVADPASGAAIDDPLAARAAPTRERQVWLGIRLSGGMFDDAASSARPGIAVALAGRYRLAGGWFAAARADWSRRGGDAMAGSIDALGASAGLGATVAGDRRGGLALALIGQLRGELRLTGDRGGAPVPRAGLGIAAGAELALPATPFTAGLRVEQGVTELVPGARDRAVLVELGVDYR